MTNQNVVVPDARKGIGITISMALSKSLFSPFVPKLLPAAPDGYFTISRKMFSKKTETEGKTNSWVDSMRDSSPTRVKPSTSLSETEEKNTWIVSFQRPNTSSTLTLSFCKLVLYFSSSNFADSL